MPDPYPFARVLIPYDGSPTARGALKFAAALAGENRDKVERLTLLRVIAGGYLARHIQNVDLRVTRLEADPTWRRIRQHHLDTTVLPALEEARLVLEEQGVKAEVTTRVAEGKVGEGMIPKLRSCIDAIRAGVGRAHILDGRVPHALLLEFFTREGIGTMITRSTSEPGGTS